MKKTNNIVRTRKKIIDLKIDDEMLEDMLDKDWIIYRRLAHVRDPDTKRYTLCGNITTLENKSIMKIDLKRFNREKICKRCVSQLFPGVKLEYYEYYETPNIGDNLKFLFNKTTIKILTSLEVRVRTHGELKEVINDKARGTVNYYLRRLQLIGGGLVFNNDGYYTLTKLGFVFNALIKLVCDCEKLTVDQVNEIRRNKSYLVKVPEDYDNLKKVISEVINEMNHKKKHD